MNCSLSCITLASFPGQFPADDVAALQVALATARPRLRTAVLCGLHDSVSAAACPLKRLPFELVARVSA